ncbi:MAG: DUF2934 domain-containing protein [Elusimicrobiota bacterium]|nr:DUF2934 domain-containing protein [Elusimicrobiota bacterium]
MKSSTMSQSVTKNRPQESKEQLATQISAKAYELWEKQGRKNGNDRTHWFEAERIIKSQTV